MPSVFLTAEWRKLIMVQYAIDPALLTPYLPRGVELDLYQGRCFVSLVGFLFDRVRVKGIAFPLHTRFPEVNLRFYVKRHEPSGQLQSETRRGVVFINEFVPLYSAGVALIAKQLYEEPYRALPMRYAIQQTADTLTASYEWKTGGRWHAMSALASPSAQPIAPGSVEEFITEHYWGYTKRSAKPGAARTSAYQVEHPRWQTYAIHSWKLDLDYAKMYGPQWSFLNEAPADNVLLAEGSAVKVYGGSDLAL
jgi:uncharacterized protein YqjF (DUF2071 family)